VSAPVSWTCRFGADTQVCPYAGLLGCNYFSKTINAGAGAHHPLRHVGAA